MEQLAHDILQYNLLHNCLETITRNFYANNNTTRETLLSGVLKLLYRTHQTEIRARYVYQISSYENKLMQICLQEKGNNFEQIVD